MGYEYEVNVESLSNAASTMSTYAADLVDLGGAFGSAPKRAECGEFIGPAFSTMTTAWTSAFQKLNVEMSDLSKAVNGSARMYLETEREVHRGFGQFAQ